MTVQGWHAPAVNTSKHNSLFCQADLTYKALIAAKVSERLGGRGVTPHILFGFIYPGTSINCCVFTFIIINSSIFQIYVYVFVHYSC